MKAEICENCGSEIRRHKQAFVHKGHILCEKCYGKLKKGAECTQRTTSSVCDKMVSEVRAHIVLSLIFCIVLGLAVGFFIGRAQEIIPIPLDPESKHIIDVSVVDATRISITVCLTNISGKDIKAAFGDVLVCDEFGQTLKTLKVHLDEPMLSGETINKSWHFYQDEIRIQQLSYRDLLQVEFVARQVIYADGTQEKFRPVQGLEKLRY